MLHLCLCGCTSFWALIQMCSYILPLVLMFLPSPQGVCFCNRCALGTHTGLQMLHLESHDQERHIEESNWQCFQMLSTAYPIRLPLANMERQYFYLYSPFLDLIFHLPVSPTIQIWTMLVLGGRQKDR